MKTDSIILSEGHLQIGPPMADARIAVFGETGQVRLVLATEPHQAIEPGPGRDLSATTLAVDMEREAAMRLLVALHNLSNEMGWPLQEAIGKLDGRQQVVRMEPRRK